MFAKIKLLSEYFLLACKPRNIKNLFVLLRRSKNFWMIYKLLLGKEIVLNYHFDDTKTFHLAIRDINDLAIMFEIFVTQVYRFPHTMKHPQTILDIGGHVWFFTILCHYLYPQTHIYTFEPDTHNFAQMQKNLALNDVNLDYVHIRNYGIGKEEWDVLLYQDFRWSDKTLYPNQTNLPAITIHIRPLHIVLQEYAITTIDVLKIDIEWAEFDLFDAWWFDRLQNVYCFFLEVHPVKEHSIKALINHIKQYFPIHTSKHIVHYFCKQS